MSGRSPIWDIDAEFFDRYQHHHPVLHTTTKGRDSVKNSGCKGSNTSQTNNQIFPSITAAILLCVTKKKRFGINVTDSLCNLSPDLPSAWGGSHLREGSTAYIGQVDDSTVLKCTIEPGGDASTPEQEHKLLEIVGRHDRIIAHKGLAAAGLYLEHARNGTVLDFVEKATPSSMSIQQRIIWCREIVEAVG
ncbi:hypothetical protein E4U55_003982 [Claviceps digitariae]|nr:hypothetical protein E4U55_003982 [Claviceps digitariae]